jgi:hypothetical protein
MPARCDHASLLRALPPVVQRPAMRVPVVPTVSVLNANSHLFECRMPV